MNGVIYFDNAATKLCKPKSVPKAARYSMKLCNPGRGGHVPALEAARAAYL
jgi:selenocysteine lyase/cysteine desulfurase